MSSAPSLETAALFELFARLTDDSAKMQEGFQKGKLISDPKENPWKVFEARLAKSYFQHGTWRFGGMPAGDEAAGVAMLRGIAQMIATKTLAGETVDGASIIAQQMAAHLPHTPQGTQIAVGLADDDTEYSGNLILIYLADLLQAKLDGQGQLRVKINGESVDALSFTFYGKPQDQLVSELKAEFSTPSATTRPGGP